MSSEPVPTWSDERVDTILGNLLRFGVVLASVVVLTGGGIFLAHHGGDKTHYKIFRGEPPELRSVPGILADVRTAHGAAIIQLGLLLLIATPVARVVFSVIAFAVQRDRIYIVVTLIVLAVLVFSMFGT